VPLSIRLIWIFRDRTLVPLIGSSVSPPRLKQSSRTVFSLEEVSFGVGLESEIFTRRWLERK
jgi:hypothetical protein